MIVLGFDTSTPATAVGLRLADGTVLQARDDPEHGERPGHATRLLPLADGLLSEAAIGWKQLERVAVGVGPGTFTGLRIGVASARGLAQSLGIALVGVSSLRALAHAADRHAIQGIARSGAILAEDLAVAASEPSGTLVGPTGVLAAIDARRSEVFVAAYVNEREILAPLALVPATLGAVIERVAVETGRERWIAVGDGAVRYRDAFEGAGVSVPGDDSTLHRIDARAICELGSDPAISSPSAASAGSLLGETAVVPAYLRRPDAEIALDGAAS